VLREQVQIGLGRALRHPELEAIPLYEDELVLVVDPKHAFAEEQEIGPDELLEVQLILFDRTSSYRRLTSEFFEGVGAVPRGVMELDNIDAAKKMVEQGLGVALLPHTAVAAELELGSLKAVTLAEAESPRQRIVIFRRRDAGPPSAPLQAFLNCLSDLRPSLQEAAHRDRRPDLGG
jgi:DNA-binding transcriptional LysR family regulator